MEYPDRDGSNLDVDILGNEGIQQYDSCRRLGTHPSRPENNLMSTLNQNRESRGHNYSRIVIKNE